MGRVLYSVAVADFFDEADGAGDRVGWIFLQAEGEGQEEQGLGVGRSLDIREQRSSSPAFGSVCFT
jgi:hypothetical protein